MVTAPNQTTRPVLDSHARCTTPTCSWVILDANAIRKASNAAPRHEELEDPHIAENAPFETLHADFHERSDATPRRVHALAGVEAGLPRPGGVMRVTGIVHISEISPHVHDAWPLTHARLRSMRSHSHCDIDVRRQVQPRTKPPTCAFIQPAQRDACCKRGCRPVMQQLMPCRWLPVEGVRRFFRRLEALRRKVDLDARSIRHDHFCELSTRGRISRMDAPRIVVQQSGVAIHVAGCAGAACST